EVLEAQADSQFMTGGGWERSIQYRLRALAPDGGYPTVGDEPVELLALLRLEHFHELEPNPNWGTMFFDDAIDGDGTMLFITAEAPLAAVEAHIRAAELRLPRAVVVFLGTRGPRRRPRDEQRNPEGIETTPFTRVMISTSLADTKRVARP
ncbi:hypothetical protein, partial [Luteitalea sp.]|uniref:hypothetical protein n=1 Tax=Luteitalea sp. TaxID=2004800 RepID=UPI0025BA9433